MLATAGRATLGAADLARLARLAADVGELELAVRALEAATARAPAPEALLDLGWYRARLGDVDGALRAYALASAGGAGARGDFEAGLLLARQGREPERAQRLLADALRREPDLVEELWEAGVPAEVLAAPRLARALQEARRRRGDA